jgi:hypothetical protein
MKRTILLSAFAVLALAPVSFAQMGGRVSIEVINGNRQPNPNEMQLMRAEEANHPNIAAAMHSLESALADLNRAPDNFGGYKGEAIADTKKAWVSLRKALYYRLMQGR